MLLQEERTFNVSAFAIQCVSSAPQLIYVFKTPRHKSMASSRMRVLSTSILVMLKAS